MRKRINCCLAFILTLVLGTGPSINSAISLRRTLLRQPSEILSSSRPMRSPSSRARKTSVSPLTRTRKPIQDGSLEGQSFTLLPDGRLLLIGGCIVALALVIAVFMPNVPQLFRYREYRRAPEPPALLRWRPNGAWALITALALAISLFGMWQRLEFLYFQF